MPVNRQSKLLFGDSTIGAQRFGPTVDVMHGETGLRFALILQSLDDLHRWRLGLRCCKAMRRARAWMHLCEEQAWWLCGEQDNAFSLAACCTACHVDEDYLRGKIRTTGMLDPVRMEDCGITRTDVEQAIMVQCHPGKRFHVGKKAA